MCWGKPTVDKVPLAEAEVEIFMTGDLAFYSLALGKENMAPHWCWRCKASKAEWTASVDNPVGELWTTENLEEHL